MLLAGKLFVHLDVIRSQTPADVVAQLSEPPGGEWSVFSCCLSSNRSSTLEAARGVSLVVKTARPQGGKGKEGHWESNEQLLFA